LGAGGQLDLTGLDLPSHAGPLVEAESLLDGRVAWVGSAHAGVPFLILSALAGSGPPVAYFRMMTPDLASETSLDSGAVLIVDGDDEVHRKKGLVPVPPPGQAVTPRRYRLGILVLALIALTLTAAALLALL
jgi:hypothetical protein